jgi:hypothetical protein
VHPDIIKFWENLDFKIYDLKIGKDHIYYVCDVFANYFAIANFHENNQVYYILNGQRYNEVNMLRIIKISAFA